MYLPFKLLPGVGKTTGSPHKSKWHGESYLLWRYQEFLLIRWVAGPLRGILMQTGAGNL